MIEPFSLPSGGWWRCSRYEIRAGRICPAPGSHLEQYNPWAAHRVNGPDGAPYESLLNLANEINLRPLTGEIPDGLRTGFERPYDLEQGSEAKVLAWCNKYGLLGLLLQDTLMISLAPRWEPQIGNTDGGERKENLFVPTHTVYLREGARWVGKTLRRAGFGDAFKLAEGSPGDVVEAELVPRDWDVSTVIHKSIRGWRREPLGVSLAPFFPNVPPNEVNTYVYPKPATKAFWAEYSEPVSDFALAVYGFEGAAANLSGGNMDEGKGPTVLDGVENLRSLLEPTSPSISLSDDGRLQQHWLSPSLLGAFSVMLLQDVAEGKRILYCDVCRKLFVATGYQARYCSDTCRHTAQKRRYRKKKKAAE